MMATRRFIETREVYSTTHEQARSDLNLKYPGVIWKSEGTCMDVSVFSARLTKIDAERAGLKWDDGTDERMMSALDRATTKYSYIPTPENTPETGSTYKTSELEGELLNWAVAKANAKDAGVISYADYCGMWEYGGPIIEREKITLFHDVWWEAGVNAELSSHYGSACLDMNAEAKGDTALVAAMRCFVMAKIGDEVEL